MPTRGKPKTSASAGPAPGDDPAMDAMLAAAAEDVTGDVTNELLAGDDAKPAAKSPPELNAALMALRESQKTVPGYYAVRVGYAATGEAPNASVSTIRGAIFLRWQDVKDFVEFAASAAGPTVESTSEDGGVIQVPFHHNVEYRKFDSLERAERYLRKVMPDQSELPKKKAGKRVAAKKAQGVKIKSLRRTGALPAFPPPKNFNPPTKKWEAMFEQAVAYRKEHGNLDVPTVNVPEEHVELSKWVKYQRTSYRYYLEDPMGGRHAMTEDKVNRLKDAGFEWVVSDKQAWLAEGAAGYETAGPKKRGRPRKTPAQRLADFQAREEGAALAAGQSSEAKAKTPRPIRPKWLAMLEKLKAYKEEHGTIEVADDAADPEAVELKQWCKNQRNMHVRWRQGHDVGMTQEKSDMLKEVGMEFPPAWEDMYLKIVQYKSQNDGSIDISHDYDPILAAWMQRQNEVLGRHLQGKSTRLGDDQAMRLLALGFQGGRAAMSSKGGGTVSVTGKSVASRDFDARWDDMYLRLRDYKAEHGHCNVPTSSGTDLAHWVAAQRRMYNKLVAGKPGKRAVLDAVKMQRLTEIGFQFRPRGSYASWDDQMKAVWKFREDNGHCRIPVNHPQLGAFVKLARRDYKNWTQGKASSMTPEREAALKEVGFVFEGGKTPQRAPGPRRSWNDRLEELLQYKAEFGHTVVPQNSGQLGAWVHSQRVHYKKYKEGQKSQMTAEKALRLTEIGFCFNASDRYRGNKRHRGQLEAEEEEAAAMEQQHPGHLAHQQQQHYHHHHLQEAMQVPPLQPYV
ncbi:hypothetical protein ACHAXT_003610 [Thalassiosira profunda]